MPTSKKPRQQDKKLIASKQKHEVDYIANRFEIPKKQVAAAIKVAGRSRAKVYSELRRMGYVVKTKTFK